MKKLLLLVTLFVAIGVTAFAQDYYGKMVPGQSYDYINTSTVLVNGDSCTVFFDVQTHTPYSFDAGVNFDYVSGTQTGTVSVYGRKASDTVWAVIAAAAASSLTNTTTVTSYTSVVRYRQIKVTALTGGTGTTTTDNVWLKIWNQ